MSRVPSRVNLIDAVDKVIGSLKRSKHDLNSKNRTGSVAQHHAVYEAYVYTLVIEALRKTPAVDKTSIVACPARNRFVIRRAPGNIQGTSLGFSYVEFSASRGDHELHIDTFVSQKTGGARLEVDISILRKSSAAKCRSQGSGNPSKVAVRLAFEVKMYTSSIGNGIAREVLGMNAKIGGKNKVVGLVTNEETMDNAESLLIESNLKVYKEISPLSRHAANVSNMLQDLATALDAALS